MNFHFASNGGVRRIVVLALWLATITSARVAPADFVVQLGAFANRGNAERLVTRVGEAGSFNALLWPIDRTPRTLTAVLVGPYAAWDEVSRARRNLAHRGLSGYVRNDPRAVSEQPNPGDAAPFAVSADAVASPSPPLLAEATAPRGGFRSWDWSGEVALQYRAFFHAPLDPRQHGDNFSLAAQPELYYEWNGGRDSFALVPFVRLDQHDDERSHLDIRELTWLTARDGWELRVGIRKVFWGVAESQHLVDIINQTDLVENIDAEDKLGQPMINVAWIRDWGTLDVFVLPYFRERTFPGVEGRLRFIPRVDADRASFESSRENKHVDVAARWSHALGDWDVGVSHFSGTSRDPRFLMGSAANGETVMFPFYEQIDQTGLDVQATKGSWLWKLEAIRRSGQGRTFAASTLGFEYTLFGVFDTSADLGLVFEHLYDDRPRDAEPPFENDLFAGVRLTLNDVQSSQALLGCIFDTDSSARICNVEASRRLGDRWMLELEIRTLAELAEDNPLFSMRRDDYAQFELSYHF